MTFPKLFSLSNAINFGALTYLIVGPSDVRILVPIILWVTISSVCIIWTYERELTEMDKIIADIEKEYRWPESGK